MSTCLPWPRQTKPGIKQNTHQLWFQCVVVQFASYPRAGAHRQHFSHFSHTIAPNKAQISLVDVWESSAVMQLLKGLNWCFSDLSVLHLSSDHKPFIQLLRILSNCVENVKKSKKTSFSFSIMQAIPLFLCLHRSAAKCISDHLFFLTDTNMLRPQDAFGCNQTF